MPPPVITPPVQLETGEYGISTFLNNFDRGILNHYLQNVISVFELVKTFFFTYIIDQAGGVGSKWAGVMGTKWEMTNLYSREDPPPLTTWVVSGFPQKNLWDHP